jgi:NitT/TauT family transport system permease protein
MKHFFGLHTDITGVKKILLGIPVFLLLLALYVNVSNSRHEANPDDKVFPTLSQMKDSVIEYTTQPESRRKQTPPMIADTTASLSRLAAGVALACVVALFIGLNMGMFRWLDALLNPLLNIASSIPPVAIMPILLIAFGKDEVGKIMMVFFGLVFGLLQTIRIATKEIPREQIIKSQTLGASTTGIVYRIVLPQIMPRVIDALRINVGLAWIFTIVAEFISSSQGLGYRIFLVRRYLDMSVILPYVFWITILGFCMMLILQYTNRILYPWYQRS